MIGKKKTQVKTNKEIVVVKKKTQTKSATNNKEIVIKKKTIDKPTEKINSKLDKEKDKFSNELDAFLNKSKGINVASLAKREQAPYFFDTGNYALNWVVSDDFFKGLPGTKAIVVAGECLFYNSEIEILNMSTKIKYKGNIGELFEEIEVNLKEKFELDVLKDISQLNLFVRDENNDFTQIKKAIVKKKSGREIILANGIFIGCSNEHLICLNPKVSKECVKANEITLGTLIMTSEGLVNVIEIKEKEEQLVYDIQIDTETHLFKTLNGITHHNSGKGKSLMCDQFLGLAIGKHNGIAYKVEVEDAGGREFTAAIVGSDEIANKIKIVEPTIDDKGKFKPITIEKLTSFLNQLVQYQISKKSKTPVMVVIDSISQLTSDKEFEDVQKEKDTRDMTVQQKMRAFFRVLTQQQRLANLTIIGVAHMTANIGVMFGPKTVINAKGSGFTYASSLNIEVKGNKEIKGKGDTTIGYMMKLKTSKNRLTFKGREVWIKFYSYGGVDRYSGLCQVLSNYGIFKPSAKPDVNGFYKDSVSFVWKENKFKEKDLPSFIKNWKDGEEALLRSWMKELNDSFEAICKRDGVSEEDLLIDDSEDEIDSTIEEQLE